MKKEHRAIIFKTDLISSLPVLDTTLRMQKRRGVTEFYRKSTASAVILHRRSAHDDEVKFVPLYHCTLYHCTICTIVAYKITPELGDSRTRVSVTHALVFVAVAPWWLQWDQLG